MLNTILTTGSELALQQLNINFTVIHHTCSGDRMRSFTQPVNLSLLEHETNARRAGSYVYRIDGNVTQPTEGIY